MELGAHYLAKLELIIMFHGALRKFRSITYTNAMMGGGGGRGTKGKTQNKGALSSKTSKDFTITRLILKICIC